jgi:hypothetical protein
VPALTYTTCGTFSSCDPAEVHWQTWNPGERTGKAMWTVSGGPAAIWMSWNSGTTNMVTDQWPYLYSGTATSSGVCRAQYWIEWNSRTANVTVPLRPVAPYVIGHAPTPQVIRTPGQVARDEARQMQQEVERAKRLQAAADRAWALLLKHLSPEQRAEVEIEREGGLTARYFHVVAASGRRYQVRIGSHGNVREVDEKGNAVAALCINAANVPQADNALAQKLMIEADEERFRKIANITDPKTGRRIPAVG